MCTRPVFLCPQVSSGFKLFSSWAQHHLPALESFLTRELLVNLLTKPSRNQANLPYLLTEALQLLQNHGNAKTFQQHLKIIEAKSAAFVQQSSDIRSIRNYLQMLVLFKESLPKADMATRLAVPLLHALAAIPIPADERQVHQFIADVSYVTDFLQELWKQSTSAMLLDCLRDLFHIISAMEGPEPSVCLGSVVRSESQAGAGWEGELIRVFQGAYFICFLPLEDFYVGLYSP